MMNNELLENGGWRRVDWTDAPSPFELFAKQRGFSLQRDLLITLPDEAIGIDFRDAGDEFELELRRMVAGLFAIHFSNETCYAIDVNHSEYEFVPAELTLDDRFEPWPFSITPWAEYATISNPDFSHGVFCNPLNRHMVVYGTPFVKRFRAEFPLKLVDVRKAATRQG